jgi:hypothetical protein
MRAATGTGEGDAVVVALEDLERGVVAQHFRERHGTRIADLVVGDVELLERRFAAQALEQRHHSLP